MTECTCLTDILFCTRLHIGLFGTLKLKFSKLTLNFKKMCADTSSNTMHYRSSLILILHIQVGICANYQLSWYASHKMSIYQCNNKQAFKPTLAFMHAMPWKIISEILLLKLNYLKFVILILILISLYHCASSFARNNEKVCYKTPGSFETAGLGTNSLYNDHCESLSVKHWLIYVSWWTILGNTSKTHL